MGRDDGFAASLWELIRRHPVRTAIVLIATFKGLQWGIGDTLEVGFWMGLGYALVATSVVVAAFTVPDWDMAARGNFSLVFGLPALIVHCIGAGLVIFSAFHYRHMADIEVGKARAEMIEAFLNLNSAGGPRKGGDPQQMSFEGMKACSLQAGEDAQGMLSNVIPFIEIDAIPFVPFILRLIGNEPAKPVDYCLDAYREMRASFPDYRTDLDRKYPLLNSRN